MDSVERQVEGKQVTITDHVQQYKMERQSMQETCQSSLNEVHKKIKEELHSGQTKIEQK